LAIPLSYYIPRAAEARRTVPNAGNSWGASQTPSPHVGWRHRVRTPPCSRASSAARLGAEARLHSDGKVANREIRVWHFVTENGD
jgi:hypothetical protein